MRENQFNEKKSLRLVQGKSPGWSELAKTCVCFANARGGRLAIGIEDGELLPPAAQVIDPDLPFLIQKKVAENTVNVGLRPSIERAPNGGQFVLLEILPSASTIAATSDGKYYYRSADTCVPLLPDELSRLFTDKPAFIWETKPTRIPKNQFDERPLTDFLASIRRSARVSPHVKQKSNDEILEHYQFAVGEFLTNLGVLWIGKRNDRANLLYAPTIHFFKYDEYGLKVNRLFWDDHSLNPMELIEAVWTLVPDWKEGIEVADGIFRRFIPNYDEAVIRELLANALVHRPYTMRGDVFINLFPERLEVVNPGLLPIGITPENILHKSARRNEKMAQVFFDLQLMEREGSGFDRMYDLQLFNGKQAPSVRQSDDAVHVTLRRHIAKPDILAFLKRADDEFGLTMKERICLGLVAQNTSLSALEFSNKLNLPEGHSNAMRDWLGRLTALGIVESQGRTRGTEYFVNPKFLKKANFKGRTTLKTIQPHRLRELIYKDLSIYEDSLINDIHARTAPEIHIRRIKNTLEAMVKAGEVVQKGANRWTTYSLSQNL